MGLQISISDANLVAWLLGESPDVPHAALEGKDRFVRRFLLEFNNRLLSGFESSSEGREGLRRRIASSLERLTAGEDPWKAYEAVREFFSSRPWTALIIPSGLDEESDKILTSPAFLREVVRPNPDHLGLVLQLDEPPGQRIDLSGAFPAFKTALANLVEWPGILLWNKEGSVFLASGGDWREKVEFIKTTLHDLFRYRAPADVDLIYSLPTDWLQQSCIQRKRCFHLVQFSDVHIGCEDANKHLPRFFELAKTFASDYQSGMNVLPVFSGDVVDSPTDGNFGMASIVVEAVQSNYNLPYFYIPGNHDCSEGGWQGPGIALGAVLKPKTVECYDTHSVCVVGFNSCDGAKFATGALSESQIGALSSEIRQKENGQPHHRIGLVHHHPVAVPVPTWLKHKKAWRFFGPAHEPFVAFEDSKRFIDFVDASNFKAVLHGHKHIPRETASPGGVPIYGAGSATGHIKTTEDRYLLSINVLSIDPATGMTSCRFFLDDCGGDKTAYQHDYVVRG